MARLLRVCHPRPVLAAHLLILAGSLAGPAAPLAWAGEPLLRCRVRYASETVWVEARPTTEPYAVKSQDIATRFRFKAVVTPAEPPATGVGRIALYTYDMALPASPVLLHQAVFLPPYAKGTTGGEPAALTGWHHVYSPRLGRELVWGCALLEVTP